MGKLDDSPAKSEADKHGGMKSQQVVQLFVISLQIRACEDHSQVLQTIAPHKEIAREWPPVGLRVFFWGGGK